MTAHYMRLLLAGLLCLALWPAPAAGQGEPWERHE